MVASVSTSLATPPQQVGREPHPSGSGGALAAQLADAHQGLAQLGDPVGLVLGDQPDAPRQRVTPAACHAGPDQRVEQLPLGQPEPGHHRHRERGEEPPFAAGRRPPGDLAPEPALGGLSDPHPLLTGRSPEAVDPGGRALAGPRPVPVERADDQDLVSVAVDLRGTAEPVLRYPLDHPGADLVLAHCRLHCYISARGRQLRDLLVEGRRGRGSPRPRRIDQLETHCSFFNCSAGRYGRGSTGRPSWRTSKWRCGPVERPVEPRRPTCWPPWTLSPSMTVTADRCPYRG